MYDKLESACAAYTADLPFSGNIRITSGGKIVYEKSFGYANIEKQIPLTADSRFTLYSLSKPFCAIGLMKLADRGLVNIDAHPGQYVPEAAGMHPNVTIRHLLHHTSGLPDFEQNKDFCNTYAPAATADIRTHLALLCDYPQYFEPGTDARYCNVNFVLCALIIENVSGMAYRDYMRKEVFEPLGMKTAVVSDETMVIPDRVQGYALVNGAMVPIGQSYNWLFGAGDILGTLDDVYCLHDAMQHRKLLQPDTWETILTPSPLNSMGMGCTITEWHGRHRITHNGGHLGFRTLHIWLPEDDFDIILLSNCGFGDPRPYFAEAIYEAWYGNGGTAENLSMDAGYIPGTKSI
ncbi:MAG: beta-lactamase family protein [Clostridia bacterium]|nr:beta-lactamase family protein [Clostridia bacterium]